MRPFALFCAATLAGTLAAPLVATASLGDDSNWVQTRFHPFGADTEVWSCIEYNGDLVVSGNFVTVDDQLMSAVARWDGSQWVGYPGIDRGGLLVSFNGQLSVVQAWGVYGYATTYLQVQSWNGSGWDTSPVIFQLTSDAFDDSYRVAAAAVVHDGKILIVPSQDLLSVNPYFEFQDGSFASIASWDGSAWNAFVPLASPADEYLDLEVWGGQVWASGFDSNYDPFIERWDGVSWTRSPVADLVYDFGEYGGSLYAAQNSGLVLTWNGASWSPHTTGVGSNARYEVSGSSAGLVLGADAARVWNGSAWNLLGSLDVGVWQEPGESYIKELMDSSAGLVATGDFHGKLAIHDGTQWEKPGKQTGRGLEGTVYDLLSHEGRLFVAGSFVHPGSQGRFGVAAWDGVNWSDGLPSNGTAEALEIYGGHPVAAGEFGVAEWDGFSWNSLGGTGASDVRSLAVFDGNLVAGGTFGTIGGVPAKALASWDGTVWSEVGGGVTLGSLDALTVWDGNLIVAGTFTEVGGSQINYIASWNGSQWRDLEPPGNNPPVVTGSVTALAVYDGNLIASGDFWDGAEVIASWDGHDWSPLGGGLDTAPQALTAYDGRLFVSAQDLSMAGGVPVNSIAVWNGISWDGLGSGLEHSRPDRYMGGWALAEHQGLLYVGGNFRVAGGKPANHLAMWTSPTSVGVPNQPPVKQAFAVKPGLPNPCRTSTRIPLSMPAAGRVTAEVFDIAGRNLGTILDRELPAGENAVVWNPRSMRTRSGATLSAGAYFIRVSALGEMRSQKVVYIP